jgi:hypothetical protein
MVMPIAHRFHTLHILAKSKDVQVAPQEGRKDCPACSSHHAATFPPPYEARRPTDSILYQTLADFLSTFVAERERELCPLPNYVRDELEAYLRCGIHHYGFLRVRCPKEGCGFEHAVPFSCKKRGSCSICFGKRAAEIEEHLTENLLPRVPYRQYVRERFQIHIGRDHRVLSVKMVQRFLKFQGRSVS